MAFILDNLLYIDEAFRCCHTASRNHCSETRPEAFLLDPSTNKECSQFLSYI